MTTDIYDTLDYTKHITDALVLYSHHHNSVKDENDDETPYIYPNKDLVHLRKLILSCYHVLDLDKEEREGELRWLPMQIDINHMFLNDLTNNCFTTKHDNVHFIISDNWKKFKCWDRL